MKHFTLKIIFSDADDSLCQSITKAITGFPPTLSIPIKKVLQEIESAQYYRGCNHMLDFFELCSQYFSFVLMRILQDNGGRKSNESLVKFVNYVDSKRSLSMGDWMSIFDKLLKTAHEEYIDNILISHLIKHLMPRGENLLIDNKKYRRTIVSIRNQQFGHNTTPSEAKCLELIKEMGERFFILIESIMPISDCKIDIFENHYIIDFNPLGLRLSIDLFPFLYLDASQDAIFIFQTLKDEKVEYVSANEQANKQSSNKMNSLIDIFRKISCDLI